MKILLIFLLISTFVLPKDICLQTLKAVKIHTTKAIEQNSTTHKAIALFYIDKAQVECVLHPTAMDATRHLKDTIERVKR